MIEKDQKIMAGSNSVPEKKSQKWNFSDMTLILPIFDRLVHHVESYWG